MRYDCALRIAFVWKPVRQVTSSQVGCQARRGGPSYRLRYQLFGYANAGTEAYLRTAPVGSHRHPPTCESSCLNYRMNGLEVALMGSCVASFQRSHLFFKLDESVNGKSRRLLTERGGPSRQMYRCGKHGC